MNTLIFSDVFKQLACSEYYRQYRPEWSDGFIKTLIADSTGKGEKKNQPKFDLAIDIGCGTGNGECTAQERGFYEHGIKTPESKVTDVISPIAIQNFDRVIGVDISEAQLENARKSQNPDNVEYRHGSAENIPLPDKCADILTGSSVLHWILSENMCLETDRVLKPGGRFIFYGCDASEIKIEFVDSSITRNPVNESYKRMMFMLYESTLQTLIDSFELPFCDPLSQYAEMKTNMKYLNYTIQTTLTGLIGLIKSYSGYWHYIKKHPDRPDPVQELQNEIMDIASKDLSPDDISLTLTFPLYMKCGRKPT